jgi:acetyl esterase
MTIDLQLTPFIARNAAAWPTPGHHLPVREWRLKYERLVAAARPPRPPGLSVSEQHIDPAGRQVLVRIYRPPGSGPLPTLVYFHGGGWVIGSVESHDDITAAIADDARCVVVSVDYARAPENPFPAAFEDGLAAVDWIFANATMVGVNAAAVFVGGDSAGGNLSTAIAMRRRNQTPALAGQVLLYPCVDTDFTRRSYLDEYDAPFLSNVEMQWFWNQYAPSQSQRESRFAVPMRASDEQLTGVAPAFIAIAEHDPLRDEGKAFASRLRGVGVPVEFDAGVGLVHGFIRMRNAATEPARIYKALCRWIRDRSPADCAPLDPERQG